MMFLKQKFKVGIFITAYRSMCSLMFINSISHRFVLVLLFIWHLLWFSWEQNSSWRRNYYSWTLPSETTKPELPLISTSPSSTFKSSKRISHPCTKSFCLAVLAKLAFKTVGVLGVPTSLRDLRILDLGVSAIMSASSLLFVGVGGHLRSLRPSFVFSKLTWSMAVPNMNWRSGVQTWSMNTK